MVAAIPQLNDVITFNSAEEMLRTSVVVLMLNWCSCYLFHMEHDMAHYVIPSRTSYAATMTANIIPGYLNVLKTLASVLLPISWSRNFEWKWIYWFGMRPIPIEIIRKNFNTPTRV